MSNQRQTFKPREKSFLNEYDLSVQGPVQSGATFPSEFRMAYVVSSNKVAIQIETKVRDAKNYGRLEILVPYLSAVGVIETIKTLINNPDKKKAAYRIKDFVFFGQGNKSEEPKVKGTLTVGRDNEGCLYMGLSGRDITPIKFIFALSKFDEISIDEVESAAQTSEFAAKVFVAGFGGLLPIIAALYYKEPEKKENRNASGNRSNGHSGGGNDNSSSNNAYDEDLPF